MRKAREKDVLEAKRRRTIVAKLGRTTRDGHYRRRRYWSYD